MSRAQDFDICATDQDVEVSTFCEWFLKFASSLAACHRVYVLNIRAKI